MVRPNINHIYAVFPSFVPKKRTVRILAFSPLLTEDLSAESHVSFTSALNLLGRSVNDLLFISCDNESKIKNIAEILSVPMIDCASHHFNLVIKLYLSPHENLLAKVNELMKKLQTMKQRAILRKSTNLFPGD